MLLRLIFVFHVFLFSKSAFCLTVTSVNHGDWDDTLTWSSNQVPIAPDTLIISKYVTFTHDLVISAPTVLIIEETGTLCGNYQINNSCGSKVYNYGYLYINKMYVRDMWNYNQFYSTLFVNISGCALSGYGSGFQNVPPNGTTLVWPPVNCRTSATNWNEINLTEIWEDKKLKVFPNPSSNYIDVKSEDGGDLILVNTMGKISFAQTLKGGTNRIQLNDFPKGIYILQFKSVSGYKFMKLILQ